MTPSNAFAEKPIPAERAIEMVRAVEGRIETASWSVEMFEAFLEKSNDVESAKRTEVGAKGEIVFEPISGRYRADIQAVSRWYDGTDPFFATLARVSFDGELDWVCETGRPGREPPLHGVYPRAGKIVKHTSDEALEHWGWSTGISYFSPYFLGRRFSEYLEERYTKGKLFSVTDVGGGVWNIHLIDEVGPAKVEFDLYIDYDFDKGVVVTSALWGGAKPQTAWKEMRIAFQNVQGRWVPRRNDCILLLQKPQLLWCVIYHDVELDQRCDARNFQIEFPKGTDVADYTRKKFYTVGSGVESDLDV
jgi:hypothetical protein